MAQITKDTKLEKVMEIPGATKILEKYNTPCLHCPMATYEMGTLKIGEIAKTYGIDLKSMLAELNKLGKDTKKLGKDKKGKK